MADTIHTRALARAATAQGSTQSLASLLRVPENTLLRWMSGRAQMPLQAFLKLMDVLTQHEKNGADTTIQECPDGEPLTLRMGQHLARCASCGGTEFLPTRGDGRVRFTSELACRACGEQVVCGNLISQLAKDAVRQSRTVTAARQKRRAGVLGRREPRALHPDPAAQKTPQGEDRNA